MYQSKNFDTAALNNTAQKTILLIDDDEDEHEIFQSALKKASAGFNFISADSCEEGLKILRKLDPDYIFVDVNMPRTNGIICLEEIKKDPQDCPRSGIYVFNRNECPRWPESDPVRRY